VGGKGGFVGMTKVQALQRDNGVVIKKIGQWGAGK